LPPVADGPTKAGTIWLNHWVALAMMAANLVALLALIALVPQHAARFVALLAAVFAVCLAALFLNRSGRSSASAWMLVAGLWVVGCASAWTGGGTTNTAIACTFVPVATGSVLLGWRTGVVLAVAAVATVWIIAYAETSGVLPQPALAQTAWVRAIWLSAFIALTAVAMVLFAQELMGARDRALEGMARMAVSERAMHAILDNAPFGAHMYHLEDDDRLVFDGYNRKAVQILGVDHDLLIGQTLEEAFPGNADTETPQAYRRVAREGGAYDLDQYAYDADGISGIFEVHAFSFGPHRMSVFFRDVTNK
jgi:PAS domain-containing protein